ncbi:MAG: hypothetical protein ACYDEF_16775 [Methanosarcina sp.]
MPEQNERIPYPSDLSDKEWEKINRGITLNPNFYGIGLNFNKMIKLNDKIICREKKAFINNEIFLLNTNIFCIIFN